MGTERLQAAGHGWHARPGGPGTQYQPTHFGHVDTRPPRGHDPYALWFRETSYHHIRGVLLVFLLGSDTRTAGTRPADRARTTCGLNRVSLDEGCSHQLRPAQGPMACQPSRDIPE